VYNGWTDDVEDSVRIHALNYRKMMADDNRIVCVDDGIDWCVLVFSITDDYLQFINKDLWRYKFHDPEGKYLVIEKMVCSRWTKSLRKSVEEALQNNFPHFEYAIWVRDKNYKETVLKVRRKDLCHTK